MSHVEPEPLGRSALSCQLVVSLCTVASLCLIPGFQSVVGLLLRPVMPGGVLEGWEGAMGRPQGSLSTPLPSRGNSQTAL